MDHYRLYESIIDKAFRENHPWTSQEPLYRHHILPRSLQGTDHIDNLVWVTAKQHFILHLLLSKVHEDQIFSCELISQSTGYPLKRWQRRRIAYRRAKNLRDNKRVKTKHLFVQKHSALLRNYDRTIAEIESEYITNILTAAGVGLA